jgi:hypothetical protein
MGFWSALGKIGKVAAPIAASFIPGVGPLVGGAIGAAGSAASNPSIWSKIASAGQRFGPAIGAVGGALGAGAQQSAQNRGSQLEADLAIAMLQQQAQRDYQSANTQRETTSMDVRSDALKKLQQAEYLKNATGKTPHFSPYSRDIAAPSQAVKDAAAGLAEQMRGRLADPYATLPAPQLTGTDVALQKPGFMEKVGGPIGTGLSFWNVLSNIGQNPQQPQGSPQGTTPMQTPQAQGGPTSFVKPGTFGSGTVPEYNPKLYQDIWGEPR